MPTREEAERYFESGHAADFQALTTTLDFEFPEVSWVSERIPDYRRPRAVCSGIGRWQSMNVSWYGGDVFQYAVCHNHSGKKTLERALQWGARLRGTRWHAFKGEMMWFRPVWDSERYWLAYVPETLSTHIYEAVPVMKLVAELHSRCLTLFRAYSVRSNEAMGHIDRVRGSLRSRFRSVDNNLTKLY